MRSETAARIVFVSLLVLTLYLMYRIFLPFLPGLTWAVVLAVVFYPLYQRLARGLRGRTTLAAVLMSLLVAAFIVVPATVAILQVSKGLAQAYTWLEQRVAAGQSPLEVLRSVTILRDAMDWAGQWVDWNQINFSGMLLNGLRNVGNTLAGQTTSFLANVFHTLITMIVLLVTMAVLFHEGPALLAAVHKYMPLRPDERDDVVRQMRLATRAVFFGVMMTALVQGVVGGIGWAIAGLPAVAMFGAAMFFAALLPSGPMIVLAPGALYLFATGRTGMGIFLALWGIAVVGTIDNFLRPVFIGKGLRMHMLLVFFGIFGGMFAFGLIGLFLGPLVITFFLILMDVVRRDLFREEAPPPAV